MVTGKNFGLAAVASFGTFVFGCAQEPNRLPSIGAPGSPEQGSTIVGAAEHGARAAVSGIESGVGFTIAVIVLLLLPFLVFVLIPRFAAGEGEEVYEGLLIAVAGLVGAFLAGPELAPLFGAWIAAGLAVATICRGGAKWVIFITFDILIGIWLLGRLASWGIGLPWWVKLGVLLGAIIVLAVGSAGNKSHAKA